MTVVPIATYGPGGLLEEKVKEYPFYSFNPAFLNCPSRVNGVHFRLISGSKGIQLCLEIDDDTTIQNIKDCWYIVDKFRNGLRKIQEENPSGGNSFYNFLLILNQDFGLSPAKIAKKLNRNIKFWLLAASREKTKSYEYNLALSKADDFLRLSHSRMSYDGRHDLLMQALQNIKDGEEPFVGEDSPICGFDIREKLRYRKKK
jgi:hypothetical protein